MCYRYVEDKSVRHRRLPSIDIVEHRRRSHKYRLRTYNEVSTAVLFESAHTWKCRMQYRHPYRVLLEPLRTGCNQTVSIIPSASSIEREDNNLRPGSKRQLLYLTTIENSTHTEANDPHVRTATLQSIHDRAIRADKLDRRSQTYPCVCPRQSDCSTKHSVQSDTTSKAR